MLWTVMVALGCTEAVMVTAILAPLPIKFRAWCVNSFARVCNQKYIKWALATIGVVVFLSFIESIRKAQQVYTELHSSHEKAHMATVTYNLLFMSQRNEYISGATLFLFYVLWRLSYFCSTIEKNYNTKKQ
ncbi:hypothetical protein Pelo_2037 [Pelomyxa schiedti]|nr:hypothetical protein Pelo_2037 [Pelomyxa schiedti]